jgi:hypothetical protein
MTRVRCDSCGAEFDVPIDEGVVTSIRRCGTCGRPALVVVDDQAGAPTDEPASA